MERRLFTSESVTEGHPDKMCDAISDAILDALMEQDPMSRVACETAVTTGLVLVMGEITTKAYVDIQKIVRETVREIGYDRAKYGFDCDTCGVITAIDEQSADIAPVSYTHLFYKRRDYTKIVNGRNPIVAHEFLGSDVAGKDVLIIDDMISSGESMLDVAKQLKDRNANRVFAVSYTHLSYPF